MRFLFISETVTGGSGRSQRELAQQLVRRGHHVLFLVDSGGRSRVTRWTYAQLSDASVKLGSHALGTPLSALRDTLGRRARPVDIEGLRHLAATKPHNALPAVLSSFQPDVVVVNSVERWTWRRIHATCRRTGNPTILYVREEDSVGHVDTDAQPDLLLANTVSLARRLEERGHRCEYIPSVVDVDVTRTTSTRQVALAINPATSKGGDMIWRLAAALPHIPFVVQESWPLSGPELESVQREVDGLANVSFRRSCPPGPDLYRDARVLLVPYTVDSRPRVILEAQANGIPVVVGDVPALADAAGPGGITVPQGSIDAWVGALNSLWADPARYASLEKAAITWSIRSEVDPTKITSSFENAARSLVAGEAG